MNNQIHNSPLKGIGVRDYYIFRRFQFLFLLFAIGYESEFREISAYLEVGSSDLEPIHEKNHFHEISDIFMGILGYIHEHSRIYSWAFSDIFMSILGYIHGHSRIYS